jgi:hypothetical protein
MCISSRQTSQGTQRIYTVNTTPLDNVKVNTCSAAYDSDSDSDSDDEIPQRAPMSCSNNDSDEDIPQRASMTVCTRLKPNQRSCGPSSNLTIEPETDDYEVSNDCIEDSPYLTQTAKIVMRSISYNSDEEKDANNKNDSDSEENANDKN